MADEDSGIDDARDGVELTEQRFAANLRVMREAAGLSQVALAQEMESRGWPWHQQTVTRIESGRRLVRLGEAKTVADVLQTTLDRLTEPTVAMQRTEALAAYVNRARAAWRQIRDSTAELLRAHSGLAFNPRVADWQSTPRLAKILEEAGAAADLSPDNAVTAGYAIISRDREFLADRHGVRGTVELEPVTYADAARMIAHALGAGDVVEVDLGRLPSADQARIRDFAAGAVAVRGGAMRALGPSGYQLLPGHGDDGEQYE